VSDDRNSEEATMPLVEEFLSEHHKRLFDLTKEPEDPFRHEPRKSHARHMFANVAADLDRIKWYRGRIKRGFGASEDGDCYVAWHKKCPLIVVCDPNPSRKYREPGEPIFGYTFQFTVSGHFSGCSRTLAGAVQEAALSAIGLDGDPSGSDSQWLRAKGGRKAFFAFHEVDIDTATPLTFPELLVEENMHPVPVLDGPYATVTQDAPAPRM
jgi:hypothetical protein